MASLSSIFILFAVLKSILSDSLVCEVEDTSEWENLDMKPYLTLVPYDIKVTDNYIYLLFAGHETGIVKFDHEGVVAWARETEAPFENTLRVTEDESKIYFLINRIFSLQTIDG